MKHSVARARIASGTRSFSVVVVVVVVVFLVICAFLIMGTSLAYL